MKEEIAATVVFITRLVKKNEKFSKQKMEKFGSKLTKILFQKYKNHWYCGNPSRGQAYRCIRINKNQPRDPVLFQACVESNIEYSSLELPKEFTIWVDPYEVWCRCGENNQPFIITRLEEQKSNREVFKHISNAAERASSDYFSGTSSDEESHNKELSAIYARSKAHREEENFTAASETKTIPIVSNPNSIYMGHSFGGGEIPGEEPQTIPTVINPKSIYQYDYYMYHAAVWPRFTHKQTITEDTKGCYPLQKIYKMYRVSNHMFAYPHNDRYHWVNTKH
ncbi:protein BTG4 [Amblyraja radiata]|uniref:protein BTG4 n=1 Tax=Amblyraja radiata TaxID=386614 RepID=UPI001402D4B6|nr:protein BTG4 [Amblyraja radiata]